MTRGALLGVNTRLDVDEAAESSALPFFLLLAVCVLLLRGPYPLNILAALFLAAPTWLRLFSHAPAPVIEWRGYFALVPVALLGGLAYAETPRLVMLLAGLYALRTAQRALYCRDALSFWWQAVQESPLKMRTRGSYGNALLAAGQPQRAALEYQLVSEYGTAGEQATAERNLAKC